LAVWEQAGFRSQLPADLPSADDALANAVPKDGDCSVSPHSLATLPLYQRVMCAGHRCFARRAKSELGIDVLLPPAGLSQEDLLDAVADLLWEHRHVPESEGNV